MAGFESHPAHHAFLSLIKRLAVYLSHQFAVGDTPGTISGTMWVT